jgi:hypothetical protein
MTVIQVNKYGIDIEANPIMRFFMADGRDFFIVKVLLVALLLLFMWQYEDLKICKLGSWVLLAVYGALAIYHIYLNIM